MKNYHKVNQTIDRLYVWAVRKNNRVHERNKNCIDKVYDHVKEYWMVYWFLITKLFAIAMIGLGIHCVVAHFNKVLPFGIVSDDMALWFIWAYTGWLIGGFMVVGGIMKLFEHTINKWLETL